MTVLTKPKAFRRTHKPAVCEKHLRKANLDYDAVTEIMNEIKPNQVEKLKIPIDDIRKYVPKSMTPAEMQAYLLKLVKQDYERQHNRDAR